MPLATVAYYNYKTRCSWILSLDSWVFIAVDYPAATSTIAQSRPLGVA